LFLLLFWKRRRTILRVLLQRWGLFKCRLFNEFGCVFLSKLGTFSLHTHVDWFAPKKYLCDRVSLSGTWYASLSYFAVTLCENHFLIFLIICLALYPGGLGHKIWKIGARNSYCHSSNQWNSYVPLLLQVD
jgi:hypothetical protein